MSAFKLQSLRLKFSSLPPADKRALLILMFFAVISALYMVTAWSFNFRQKAVNAFKQDIQLIPMLYEAKSKTVAHGVSKVEGSDQALLTLVSTTANDQKIVFKRYQPEGENVLKLWLENTSFNNLLLWLHRIDKKNGISVQEISVEQAKEQGYVDVRLTLVR